MSPDSHVSRLLVRSAHCLRDLDVFVIAGGVGTRIEPVLGKVPKLLAPIGGRPYLSYLLGWLRQFDAKRVVLGLGHHAEVIVNLIEEDPVLSDGLVLESLIEPEPLGTAGAVRFARGHLHTDPVLVMNGDSFADVDLCKFVEHHRRSKAKATLLCAEVDDAGRYGRVDIDGMGRIRGFVEKDPKFHGGSAVSAGVYLFSAAMLDEIAAGTASSLERGVFGCAPAGSFNAFSGRFNFIDIGTPESLSLAGKVMGSHTGSVP